MPDADDGKSRIDRELEGTGMNPNSIDMMRSIFNNENRLVINDVKPESDWLGQLLSAGFVQHFKHHEYGVTVLGACMLEVIDLRQELRETRDELGGLREGLIALGNWAGCEDDARILSDEDLYGKAREHWLKGWRESNNPRDPLTGEV